MTELTQSRLKELLSYDQDTGLFTRVKSWCNVKQGTIAGNKNRDGYSYTHIDGVRYLCHRLAWLYMTGSWPKEQIDHVDCDKSNNKWLNLREATREQNLKNLKLNKRNTSGYKGVAVYKSGRFVAKARVNGKTFNLGSFATAKEAGDVYNRFAKQHHGEFYNEGR